MERYNVYDRVWTMVGEKPSELIVFAVIESMDGKRSTEIYYRLVRRSSGAVWRNRGHRTTPKTSLPFQGRTNRIVVAPILSALAPCYPTPVTIIFTESERDSNSVAPPSPS